MESLAEMLEHKLDYLGRADRDLYQSAWMYGVGMDTIDGAVLRVANKIEAIYELRPNREIGEYDRIILAAYARLRLHSIRLAEFLNLIMTTIDNKATDVVTGVYCARALKDSIAQKRGDA